MKKTKLLKMISILMTAIILITSSPGQVFGAATGNDIVNVATKELGNGSRKYTTWFGKIGDTYTYAWCHAFVSWCAAKSGAGTLIPKTANCETGVHWFENKGQWKSAKSGYVPKAGDIIYFDWKADGTYDHVGIVTYVKNGRVHTIEGNARNLVKKDGGYSNGYALSDKQILGYGVPKYASAKSFEFWSLNSTTVSGAYKFWWKQQNYGSAYMKLYVDGKSVKKLNQDSNGYFSYILNTASYADGKHNLKAVLYDKSGKQLKTISKTIKFSNPKTFQFWALNSKNISGVYKFWWKQQNYGASYVELYVDGKYVGKLNMDTNGYFSYVLNTIDYKNGDHVLKAVLYDKSGNRKKTVSEKIKFSNIKSFEFWALNNTVLSGNYKLWWKQKNYGNCYMNFYVDNIFLQKLTPDSNGYFSYILDTKKYKNGVHTLKAVIKNAAGDSVTVTKKIEFKNKELAPVKNVGTTVMKNIQVLAYNQIKVSWNKTENAEGYRIYRKTDDSDWVKIKDVGASETSYIDKNIVTRTKYHYTVRAYRVANGKMQWGAYKNTVSASTNIGKPALKSINAIAKNKNQIKWGKVTGAEGYRIYRRTAKEDWTKIKTVTPDIDSYTDNKAASGVTYQYTVRAYRVYNGQMIWGSYNDAYLTVKTK